MRRLRSNRAGRPGKQQPGCGALLWRRGDELLVGIDDAECASRRWPMPATAPTACVRAYRPRVAEHTVLHQAWRWRVDELPATAAEDSPIAHDYTSLVLEFENGQDLTRYWSAGLPIDTRYRCPCRSGRRARHIGRYALAVTRSHIEDACWTRSAWSATVDDRGNCAPIRRNAGFLRCYSAHACVETRALRPATAFPVAEDRL